ncbi:MAG: hypothetical protein ACRCZI_06775 [Cetobacterium sp.]
MSVERVVLRAKYNKEKKALEKLVRDLIHDLHKIRGLNRELVARVEELEGKDNLFIKPTIQETSKIITS